MTPYLIATLSAATSFFSVSISSFICALSPCIFLVYSTAGKQQTGGMINQIIYNIKNIGFVTQQIHKCINNLRLQLLCIPVSKASWHVWNICISRASWKLVLSLFGLHWLHQAWGVQTQKCYNFPGTHTPPVDLSQTNIKTATYCTLPFCSIWALLTLALGFWLRAGTNDCSMSNPDWNEPDKHPCHKGEQNTHLMWE